MTNATSLLNATGSALATTVAAPVANATSAAAAEGSCGHEDSAIHLELKHALENQTCDVQMVTWNSKVGCVSAGGIIFHLLRQCSVTLSLNLD